MIVVCPSCATRYDLPAAAGPEGSIVRCRACGYSWLEGNAVEVLDGAVVQASGGALVAADPRLGQMAERLMRASREAAEAETEARRRRQARRQAWLSLAAAVALPLGLAVVFADWVQDRFPRTSHVYALIGVEPPPVFEITRVEQKHLMADGTRVLAIRGEIANHSSKPRHAPGLHFELTDDSGRTVYAWTLGSVTTRAMKPGETTTFVTRLASPPIAAARVKIGFAQPEELALNAAHDGSNATGPAARNPVQ
jgi:predicted Zn finger-like uncharacterized protein